MPMEPAGLLADVRPEGDEVDMAKSFAGSPGGGCAPHVAAPQVSGPERGR